MKQVVFPKTRNVRLWVVGLAVLAFGGMSWLAAPTAKAESNGNIGWIQQKWKQGGLTQYSPNSEFLRIYNSEGSYWSSQWSVNNTTRRNGYEHLLKNEASSLVNLIRMYVYARSTTPPTNTKVELDVDRCAFSAPSSYLGDRRGGQWFSIRKGSQASSMQELNGERGVLANNEGDNSRQACSYARRLGNNPISLSASDFRNDPTTGLQRAIIEFRLTDVNGNLIDPNSTPPVPQWDGTEMNGIRFQARAFSDTPGESVFIGLPGRTVERQFGIVEGADSGNIGYGVKAAFPFGVPCNENGDLQNQTIRIYDSDPRTFGGMNIFVLKRKAGTSNDGVMLSRNEYSNLNNLDFKVDSGWLSTENQANNTESSVRINMDKDNQYLLVIVHPNRANSPGSPLGNVLSIRLPSDSATGIVDCSYELFPSVQGAPETFEGTRPDFDVTGQIEPSGNDNETHDWKFTARVYDNKPSDMDGTDNRRDPCEYRAGNNCKSLDQNTKDGGFHRLFSTTKNPSNEFPEVQSGQWICFMMSVKKPTGGSPDGLWRHSRMQCSTPGTQPKVQVWGYDARLNGQAVTSTSMRDRKTLGSWSEYGAFSTGINHRFASSSALNGGVNGQPANSTLHELTFANTRQGGGGDVYGKYGELAYPLGLVNALIAQCGSVSSVSRTIDSDVSAGSKICSQERVTINHNITNNNGSTADLNSLRQTVIIAKDIVIGQDVTNIDAWLIATNEISPVHDGGRISTCRQASDGANLFPSFSEVSLTTQNCSERLRVNGPIVADGLYLFRTSPSGDSGQPAERFNLRADAFLWAYSGGGSATAHTVSVKELPPRF